MSDNQTIDPRKKIPLDFTTLLTIEKVVHDEAANQGQRGRDAVRAVIYNRVAAGVGGKDVISVLNAKNQFQGVGEKAGGDATRLQIPEKIRESLLAEHMDFLRRGEDPTGGATFFLNKTIAKNPFNVNYKGLKIGNHEFFNHYNGRKVSVPQYEVALRGSQGYPTKAAKPEKSAQDDTSFLGKAKRFVGDLLPFGDSKSSSPQAEAAPTPAADETTTFGPLKPNTAPSKAPVPLTQKYEGELLPLRRGGYVGENSKFEDDLFKESDMGKVKMNCGGMMAPEYEMGYDEESGNPIPPGSLPVEVRDDIPAMLSEGEFVLPADVVRWHGLKHIMDMRTEAKMGLMAMTMDGLLHEGDPVDPEEIDEETETETPEGNKVTKVTPKIEEEGMELEEEDSEYAKMLKEPYGDERVIVLMKSDPSIFRKT